MSKRRINKQQSQRIIQLQNRYQQIEVNPTAQQADGLVLTRFGKQAEVEDETGKPWLCAIRPHLPSLVAGDRVIWQAENEQQGVVLSLYPRTSVLARPTERGLEKPVAANITQLMIVIAPKPEINWELLDSYLIMAETLHLKAVIVLNKIDLSCEALKSPLADYQDLNYPILLCAQRNQTGLKALQQALKNQISVFVGQSGVGKSSLISSLLPQEVEIRTQEISTETELGKHTTSNSRYYHLPSGGALIDSPGVRVFGLWQMDVKDIAKGYTEFRPYLSHCKFRNCSHQATPKCAILDALEQGRISPRRYENFLKLCAKINGA